MFPSFVSFSIHLTAPVTLISHFTCYVLSRPRSNLYKTHHTMASCCMHALCCWYNCCHHHVTSCCLGWSAAACSLSPVLLLTAVQKSSSASGTAALPRHIPLHPLVCCCLLCTLIECCPAAGCEWGKETVCKILHMGLHGSALPAITSTRWLQPQTQRSTVQTWRVVGMCHDLLSAAGAVFRWLAHSLLVARAMTPKTFLD